MINCDKSIEKKKLREAVNRKKERSKERKERKE